MGRNCFHFRFVDVYMLLKTSRAYNRLFGCTTRTQKNITAAWALFNTVEVARASIVASAREIQAFAIFSFATYAYRKPMSVNVIIYGSAKWLT